MKRQATRPPPVIKVQASRKNPIYSEEAYKPHVTIKGLMFWLCIAGLVNLAIALKWCSN